MITRGRSYSDTRDVMEITDGYIITFGSHHVFSEGITFEGRTFRKPGFGVYKVHDGHPIKIIQNQGSLTSFAHPKIDFEKDKRMPAEWYTDKLTHDLAYFVMLPMDVDLEKFKTSWKKFAVIDDGFVRENGERNPVSLLYAEHGLNCGKSESRIAFPAMQTQVPYSFFLLFLKGNHQVYSRGDKMDDEKLEGRFDISWKEAGRVMRDMLVPTLEERFDDIFLIRS
jgi:hypothetical protein